MLGKGVWVIVELQVAQVGPVQADEPLIGRGRSALAGPEASARLIGLRAQEEGHLF